MDLNPCERFETLSAGLKRRAMLARGLVSEPDVLLLDEPTNHLDIDAIGWMEEFLLHFEGALLFVTHDRRFLGRLATRTVELDRGRLIDWSCDYETYQKRKQAALATEAVHRERFDNKLAREEAWVRQSTKARRTRNEGRVRELEKLREARRARRELIGSVRMKTQDAADSGKLVIEAKGVSYGYGGQKLIIDGFSTTIMRGDKTGIIGPNGSGKTTLLRVLLGDLSPQGGVLRHGVNLETAYFDQLRAQFDENKSVAENVGGGNDTILFNGRPRHVMGYLQDFLFSPERARSPVSTLSGGERNRLLLARLFTKPSNLLVLDEPTNDLDVETLELLEDLLLDYPGTLLLVSHDRTFLNNVVTSTLVLEGEGRVCEYVGGYDDWVRQRGSNAPISRKAVCRAAKTAAKTRRQADNQLQGTARTRRFAGSHRTARSRAERAVSIHVRPGILPENRSRIHRRQSQAQGAGAETRRDLPALGIPGYEGQGRSSCPLTKRRSRAAGGPRYPTARFVSPLCAQVNQGDLGRNVQPHGCESGADPAAYVKIGSIQPVQPFRIRGYEVGKAEISRRQTQLDLSSMNSGPRGSGEFHERRPRGKSQADATAE